MKYDKLQEHWFEAYPVEGDQLIPTKVYGKTEVDETIAELEAENRKLKRALWFARAMMADYAAHWTVYLTYMHYHENSFYAFDGDDIFHRHNKNLDGFKLWCSKWETVKGKCLKKAEEYK